MIMPADAQPSWLALQEGGSPRHATLMRFSVAFSSYEAHVRENRQHEEDRLIRVVHASGMLVQHLEHCHFSGLVVGTPMWRTLKHVPHIVLSGMPPNISYAPPTYI
mmetsp:Transcript_28797/g.73943  ORF Transcript_28797/g.73943 Transcript_28797/m.73943 type:complete len:106 (-) Transcript_28797:82-399(-)